MKKILALLLAITPATAFADSQGATSVLVFTNSASTNKQNVLEGVALNAAAGTRTLTTNLGKRFSKLRVVVNFTRAAATDVQAVPSCSQDGTNYARVTSRSIASGTGAVSQYTDVRTTSATEIYELDYDVRGCEKYQIVFSGTSAGGSDLISIQAVAVVGE